MAWLRAFVDNNDVTVIAVSVMVIFLGLFIAAKMDSKWGYLISLLSAVLLIYTLMVNGIFNL